ncbi:MAG: CBS domain-containing protein [Nitrospinae bacterium]|nr:CBS domain-containing protein [Nitrospinota bacterium]
MSALPQPESPKEKLGDFMTTPIKCVDVNATIQEAAKQMDAKNISALITTDNGNHVGIVTERDFTRKVVGEGLAPTEPVSKIMSTPLYTMDANQHIFEAVEFMTDNNTRHITVTEKNEVVGILTIKNTFSYYMKLFGLEL